MPYKTVKRGDHDFHVVDSETHNDVGKFDNWHDALEDAKQRNERRDFMRHGRIEKNDLHWMGQ